MEETTAARKSPTLTPDQIRARVSELGTWFHNLNLAGVSTAPDHFLGDYPSTKWRAFEHAIPRDLRGASVLDIGCNAGFYSIEMKRRGAERVVGIDSSEVYLEQARFAADVCGARIELRRMSVYEVESLHEHFDLVLFMGVLYHLRHPLLALDLLREHVVKDTLIFQTMQRGSEPGATRLAKNYPFTETAIFDQDTTPRAVFIEDAYAGDPTNWWIPNPACSMALLRSSGFEIVSRPEPEVYVCRPRNLSWLERELRDLPRIRP